MRLSSLQLQRSSHVSCDLRTRVITSRTSLLVCVGSQQITNDTLCPCVFPPAAPVEVGTEEEDVHCSGLMFKEDFLTDQYFGENRPASIITEKVHFGEGMHRRAFRTKLHAGQIPLLVPGHSCVLKVHNSISYGTKNNDELIQKNFTLAVEVRTSPGL